MPIRLPQLTFYIFCVLGIAACNSSQTPSDEADKKSVIAEATSVQRQTSALPATAQPPASIELFLLDTAAKSSDTLVSLRKQYGDANVIEGELPGAEGETAQGWIIYPNDPEKKLMLYLDESNVHPGSLLVDEAKSKWHLSNSIKLGTDSKTLEKLNGKTFSFYGFYWDYGGVISDWNGGELNKKTANGSNISIHLCPPEDSKLPDNYLSGDGTFKSDNPLARKFPPVVCQLGVYFPDEKNNHS